jgi:hypothetical protein
VTVSFELDTRLDDEIPMLASVIEQIATRPID